MPETEVTLGIDLDAIAEGLAVRLRPLLSGWHVASLYEPAPYVRVLTPSLAITNPFQVTWRRDDGRVDTVELDETDAGQFAEQLCAGLGWRIVKGGGDEAH